MAVKCVLGRVVLLDLTFLAALHRTALCCGQPASMSVKVCRSSPVGCIQLTIYLQWGLLGLLSGL